MSAKSTIIIVTITLTTWSSCKQKKPADFSRKEKFPIRGEIKKSADGSESECRSYQMYELPNPLVVLTCPYNERIYHLVEKIFLFPSK